MATDPKSHTATLQHFDFISMLGGIFGTVTQFSVLEFFSLSWFMGKINQFCTILYNNEAVLVLNAGFECSGLK